MPGPIPQSRTRRAAPLIIAAVLWAFSLPAAAAEVGIFAEKPVISSDDSSQNILISARSARSVAVDLHVVLISPGATIYSWPDWNTVLRPALSLTIPAGFDFPAAVAFDAAEFPAGLEPGTWTAAIGVAEPGTLNFIDVALARFQVVDEDDDGDEDTSFGAVSLSRVQSASGVDVAAEGIFFELDGDLDDLETAYLGDTPGIGQCLLYEVPIDLSALPDFDVDFLDAGPALPLARNGGPTLTLPKDADAEEFGAIIYSADAAPGDYVGNRAYEFAGPGGPDVGRFRAPVQSPPALNLIRPGVASPLDQPVSRDLVLEWSGSDVDGEVDAILGASTLSTVVTIHCRFQDRGTGRIPARLLGEMKSVLDENQQGGGPLPPIPGLEDFDLPPGFELPVLPAQATLSVSRVATTFFDAPGLDLGIATIDSSAEVGVNLQ